MWKHLENFLRNIICIKLVTICGIKFPRFMIETILIFITPFAFAFIIRFVFVKEALGENWTGVISLLLAVSYNAFLYFYLKIELNPLDMFLNVAAETFVSYKILRL